MSTVNLPEDNSIINAFLKHSRNPTSPAVGRRSEPEKARTTGVQMMDGYLQSEKRSEQFMTLRERQRARAKARIEKCNQTILKCLLEQDKQAMDRVPRVSCPITLDQREDDFSAVTWRQTRASDRLLSGRPFSRDTRIDANLKQLSTLQKHKRLTVYQAFKS